MKSEEQTKKKRVLGFQLELSVELVTNRCKIVAKNRELQKIFEIFIKKPQYVQFGK